MKLFCPHCKKAEHMYVSQKMISISTVIECKECKDFYVLKFTRHVKPLTVFEAGSSLKKEEK
jgi:hypothetical protein